MLKFNQYTINESKSEMDILNAITHVLELEKKPLSMIEIWSKISELGLLPKSEFDRINNATKSGKIVGIYSGYLDTLLSRSSINTKRADSNKKNLFEIVGSRPNMKYKLVGKNEEDKKYSFIEAAQIILKENGNKPMTSSEIWSKINDKNLVNTLGKTPAASLNSIMLRSSDNGKTKNKYGGGKNFIFTISDFKAPYKFVLINPNDEVQSVPDEDFEEIPNVYCVRAGVANKDANIFLEGGFVGINYDTQGFDLSVKTKEEIIELLSSRDSSKRAIQQYVQQIELFKEIQDGDIILVPDSDGTNIGEVLSDMYLAEGEYPNRINVEWLGKIEKNSSLNIPKTVFKVNNFNTDDLKFTNDESDNDDIETFSTRFGIPIDFKAVQAQEEKETKEYVKNPFRQSICVLGDSGAGKSTTLENILESEEHEFEFIIPSASTTGLLSQFSPSKSGYIKSRLGRMLVESFNNPRTLYTAVFDECHKSNVIEMINDELLQAISIKRNNERRFISLDEDTSELYKGADTHRGNIIIPDNFGFIFISSKPRIISNNTDFFNRVDLVVLTESDRNMKTTDELLSKVLPEEEKMKLASTRND